MCTLHCVSGRACASTMHECQAARLADREAQRHEQHRGTDNAPCTKPAMLAAAVAATWAPATRPVVGRTPRALKLRTVQDATAAASATQIYRRSAPLVLAARSVAKTKGMAASQSPSSVNCASSDGPLAERDTSSRSRSESPAASGVRWPTRRARAGRVRARSAGPGRPGRNRAESPTCGSRSFHARSPSRSADRGDGGLWHGRTRLGALRRASDRRGQCQTRCDDHRCPCHRSQPTAVRIVGFNS